MLNFLARSGTAGLGLLLSSLALGPCSKDEGPTPSGEAGLPTHKGDPTAKTETRKPDQTGDIPPAPLMSDKGWWGRASGTGKGGGTWELTLSNCTKDALGPWKGHYTYTAQAGPATMSGSSTSFPPFTFPKGFGPVPVTVRVKVKTTGMPGGVKLDIDSTANLVATIDPMKKITLTEKSEQGTATAKGPQGQTSVFGAGVGQPMEIALTGDCEGKGDAGGLPQAVPLADDLPPAVPLGKPK